jgi:hypothetical protein
LNVAEHILLAEKTLGKILPKKALVHHWNGYGKGNKDLVICEDFAYHNLLHARERAYRETGHANYKKCYFCKEYDDPENLYLSPNGRGNAHRICKIKNQQNYRIKRKESLCMSLSN